MIIVCPSCFEKNNLPTDQDQPLGQCQQCTQQLNLARPIDLDDDSFKRFVPETQALVLVDFWAPWCGPCQAMAYSFQHIAKQYPNLYCAKVNTDAAPEMAELFQIKSIPSLVLFRQGKLLARIAGQMNVQQMQTWLAHHGVNK